MITMGTVTPTMMAIVEDDVCGFSHFDEVSLGPQAAVVVELALEEVVSLDEVSLVDVPPDEVSSPGGERGARR